MFFNCKPVDTLAVKLPTNGMSGVSIEICIYSSGDTEHL